MIRLRSLRVNFKRFTRALASNNKAAHWALLRTTLTPFTNFVDSIVPGPNPGIAPLQDKPRWIFLCSPPRSGSTVIYQVMTRVLDCVFVSNLHQLFPRHAAAIIDKLGFLFREPRELISYYGHTREFLNVNEGNTLVDSWFRKGDSSDIRARFLKTISQISGGRNLPVIIKNVGAYDRLANLSLSVPELIFVRIRRNRQQVVESELKAFHDLGYFNPIPKELNGLEWTNPAYFAVQQITAMERVLDEQLSRVPPSRVIEISYERFCTRPEAELAELAELIQVSPDWNLLKVPLKAPTSPRVDTAEALHIKSLLQKSNAENVEGRCSS